MTTKAFSGRSADTLDVDAVRRGEIGVDDLRISPDTLERQAQVAEAHANPQLAANFRRAAELAMLDDAEVLALYELLRPHRATTEQLVATADDLEARGAVLVGELVREAAQVYARRGLST
jgi:propanediol dehydratase small subunit